MKNAFKKSNKILESLKKGFADIKLVLEEGNYKLFLKQFIVIILLVFAYRYVNGALQQKDENVLGQIDAVRVQQDNEKDYLANKKKLLELEPRFPDLNAKNDWLLRQVIAVFRDAHLSPKISSTQSENSSNSGYTVASLPVELRLSYKDFGRLLAEIESQDEYLRVSEFSLSKEREPIGQNNIKLKINTVFPKEKIAASMFKEAAGTKDTKKKNSSKKDTKKQNSEQDAKQDAQQNAQQDAQTEEVKP